MLSNAEEKQVLEDKKELIIKAENYILNLFERIVNTYYKFGHWVARHNNHILEEQSQASTCLKSLNNCKLQYFISYNKTLINILVSKVFQIYLTKKEGEIRYTIIKKKNSYFGHKKCQIS